MEPKTTKKPSRKLVVFKRELPFYLMLIPGVTFLIIFSYLPMFGLVMALMPSFISRVFRPYTIIVMLFMPKLMM